MITLTVCIILSVVQIVEMSVDFLPPKYCSYHVKMRPDLCHLRRDFQMGCANACNIKNATIDFQFTTVDKHMLIDPSCKDKSKKCKEIIRKFTENLNMSLEEKAVRICTSRDKSVKILTLRKKSVGKPVMTFLRHQCKESCGSCLRYVRTNCLKDATIACYDAYTRTCPDTLAKSMCQLHCNSCKNRVLNENVIYATHYPNITSKSKDIPNEQEGIERIVTIICVIFLCSGVIVLIAVYFTVRKINRQRQKHQIGMTKSHRFIKAPNKLIDTELPPPPPTPPPEMMELNGYLLPIHDSYYTTIPENGYIDMNIQR